MSRRRGKDKPIYNFSKDGSFGYFSTDITVPIEFMLTTFGVDELSKLSFARETQTTLNFDLLIQRDIDEERAIAEISQYISPSQDKPKTDDIVFLPPLLVAIVPTDEKSQILEYYPERKDSISKDEVGEIYVREWANLFKVTHYDMDNGYPLDLTLEGEESTVRIDPSKVTVEFALSNEDEAGAKLVVIDGQHRLYALKHLRKHFPEKIRKILLPVCILYSPDSTEANQKGAIPPVPKVLRDLFIDVNSTVEKVSGHFEILLSDRTLSSAICRAFCDEVMNKEELGRKALSLIEWNTKNYKQSLTISKNYTITSLGVLDEVFKEVFKTRDGKVVLKHMINVGQISDDLDFGADENDEPLSMPDEFPWRDFRHQNKPYLDLCIREHFVPNLIKIFFRVNAYKKHFEIFSRVFSKELENLVLERTPEANHAQIVIGNFLDFNPLYDNGNAKALKGAFLDKFDNAVRNEYPRIVRNNVFQKGMLNAWIEIVNESRKKAVSIHGATDGFVTLMNKVLDSNLDTFNNDAEHSYLQESVYSGVKIRPNKEGRTQIKRLILSFLGNNRVVENVIDSMRHESNVDFDKLRSSFLELGQSEAAYFASTLYKARRKVFIASFKSDLSLSQDERSELVQAQHELSEAKEQKKQNPSIEIPKRFEELVKRYIERDFDSSIAQISSLLGFEAVPEEESEDDGEE